MNINEALSSPLIPQALREALGVAPGNAPLLAHVGETLLNAGAAEEAEAVFKQALSHQPGFVAAQAGLAFAFFRMGKFSAALVIVEELEKAAPVAPRVLLLHARLAFQAGERAAAARFYLQARTADLSLVDPAFEDELGGHLQAPPPVSLPKKQKPAEFGDGGDDYGERERVPAGDLPEGNSVVDVEKPALDFSGVGGMETAKDDIRMKIILPLRQPELFKAYGKKAGGGILMYGPPGCGKTFLARATAGEVKAGFLSVGISDVLDMWIGSSEKNLRAIFEQARSHRPCVLFFDEVDALGANRTDMLKSGGRQIINQFLSELDGVDSSNEGVLILAATNTPWHLDPAFRRPGRFDRILFVPPPDAGARAAILRIHLGGKPQDDIDFEGLAKKTEGFSGADLRAVVEVAVEAKLREALKTGRPAPLRTGDIADAVKRQRPTVRDWFETARNHALYANQSGLYDDILAFLKIKK